MKKTLFATLSLALLLVGVYAWAGPDAGLPDSGIYPTIPNGPNNRGDSVKPVSPQTTFLLANGSACSTPSSASCTVILSATNVSAWDNVTVYVKNVAGWADAGGATSGPIADILIEVSPNGADWEEAAANSLDALGTGVIRSVNYVGHFAYLRVEGRAVANTTVQVWVSAFRP
jgi:hypothetical protein